MKKAIAVLAGLALFTGCAGLRETTKAGSGLFNRTNGNQQLTISQVVDGSGADGVALDPKSQADAEGSIVNIFNFGQNSASQEAGLEGIKSAASVAGKDSGDASLKDKKKK